MLSTAKDIRIINELDMLGAPLVSGCSGEQAKRRTAPCIL